MLAILDKLLYILDKHRRPVALSFFLFGSPIIYFVRDFLGVFKGSQTFTSVILAGCLLFLLPLTLPKKLFSPNNVAYFFNLSFLGLAFLYLLTYAPNRGWFTNTPNEIKYYTFIFFIYFSLVTVSINSVKDKFLFWTIIFSTLGALLLIVVVARDPTFTMGMRASIKFKDPGSQEGAEIGNPHVFAKVSMAGIASILSLFQFRKVFISRLVMIGLMGIFFVVIALTMSMVYTLALLLILFAYALVNFNLNTFRGLIRWIFGWQGLSLFVVLVAASVWAWNYTDAPKKVELASKIIFARFDRILNTIGTDGGKEQHFSTIDYSAQGRVESIKKVFTKIEQNFENSDYIRLALGNGYQELFVDSPIFETYHDLGIMGFLLYTFGLIWVIYCAIKEIRKPSNPFTLFVGYVTLYLMVSCFTAGMPYSYEWWSGMAFSSRFLVKYKPNLIFKKQPQLA